MNTEAMAYQEGQMLDYTPTAAKVAGQVVQAGGRAGICVTDIEANVKGAVLIAGIVKMNNGAVSGSKGDPVGWDEDGTPVDGTAASGCLTTDLSVVDFLVGSLTAALAATDVVAYVELNKFVPNSPVFEGFKFETLTDNKTLDIEDVGKAFIMTVDAKTITLPATAAGLGPIVIINGGADGAVLVTVQPNSSDKIMGPDIAGADNAARTNTKTTAKHWDYIVIHPDIAGAGWEIQRKRGIWA
jgi:predicted RecA/RadA family phage recombinase